MEAFPDEKIYESDVLFPVFASRLPDKKRRDIDKILEKYELSEFDEFELLPNVTVGEQLYFETEPDNPYDSNAIRIVTQNKDFLGYVPGYYNSPIIERMNKGVSYLCKITDINLNQDCTECIKVRLKMPKE